MRARTSSSVLAVLVFAACAGEEVPESYPDAVTADPDHYSVAFENDAVRILRIEYGPGETSVMHHHPPSCAIVVSGGDWTMHLPDGTSVDESLEAGGVRCYPAGDHRPENMSGGMAVLVELKDGATAAGAAAPADPPAHEADPAHYTVLEENDVYRLVRVRYGAGETSVMHHHPEHCVVYVTPVTGVTFQMPDGEVVQADDGAPGDVQCGLAGGSHLPTNTGEAAFEAVLIELK